MTAAQGDPTRAAKEAPLLLHVTTVPMTLHFLGGQVGYMKERGLRVHALSSPGPDLVRFATTEQVPVSAVTMERRITPLRDLKAIAGIVRVIRRTRPAIVHSHTPKGGLLGMIAASLSRVPVKIYHMRGLPLIGATGLRRLLLWWTERVACRLADQVLCVSHSIRRTAIREKLCPPDKIEVLAGGSGNGVDADVHFNPERIAERERLATRSRLGIPSTAPAVGFVGRIVRDKGIVELAQAWQRLREDHPEAHLLLVGPFEDQDSVPPETEALLRGDPRVRLAGMDWNTPPLYAAMDVVALPTYREGFPNVPLEAAAMELPVVATRIPGCVDAIIDGVTGTLVPPRDADALHRALDRYLVDAALRRTHGVAARERVCRDFRQEVVWEALHGTYVGLLRGRGFRIPPPPTIEQMAATARKLHGTVA